MGDIDINSLMNKMNGFGGSDDNGSGKKNGGSGKNNQSAWKKPENRNEWNKKNSFNDNKGKNFSQNGSQNRGNFNRKDNFCNYVGAPYNFVPFNKNVVGVDDNQMAVHDKLDEELLTGELEYTIKAQTPIFIDDGKKGFFKNERNQFAIPGSSVRGLIRSNAQVLGFSSFDEDIDDYRLMVRDITNNLKNKWYNDVLGSKPIILPSGAEISALLNVSAGYLRNINGEYKIYPSVIDKLSDALGKMNYYILDAKYVSKHEEDFSDLFSEPDWYLYKEGCKFVREESFKGKYNNEQVSFCFKNEDGSLTNEIFGSGAKAFSFEGTVDDKRKRKKVIITRIGREGIYSQKGEKTENKITINYSPTCGVNENYLPTFRDISYEVKGRFVTKLGKAGKYSQKGMLLGSGFMNNKKVMYVIPEEKEIKGDIRTIDIPEKDINSYKVDYAKKKNVIPDNVADSKKLSKEEKENRKKKIQAFYALPEEGEKKPVFYIEFEGHLYFGFTPRLRLFYDHSVKEGFKQKKAKFDFSKSLFGCISEKTGYKSKVSFSDAVLHGALKQEEKVNVIIAEPKSSSYFDYIMQDQDNAVKTYNSSEFELRGLKQYWLRKEPILAELSDNKNVGSELNPLAAESEFVGKIRFQNLTKEELGLLIWSVKLEDNCQMNIGKGKPYGYGRISFEDLKLSIVENEKAYSLETFDISPVKPENAESFINAYKSFMNSKQGRDIMTIRSIKDFFSMKDINKMPDADAIRYMDINKGEYQSRTQALKSVGDTISKENR